MEAVSWCRSLEDGLTRTDEKREKWLGIGKEVDVRVSTLPLFSDVVLFYSIY